MMIDFGKFLCVPGFNRILQLSARSSCVDHMKISAYVSTELFGLIINKIIMILENN